MANGDVDHTDIDTMIQGFEATSTSEPSDTEVDEYCDFINAEVNLALTAAGFVLNLTNADNIAWAEMTKRFGAGSLTLDFIYTLTGNESDRAQRWWDTYERRIQRLLENPNLLDDADKDTDPRVNYAPVLVGYYGVDGRRRHLKFRERAAVQQRVDEVGIERMASADRARIRRV
jgi:hypothetical protein